ncbi:hypothetical protein K461DRAFT_115298 [Myriangium duriaei CBS 260.36]|uniref:Uncharacterized protein n=1 Tax=Myriangium duriaei CBS 260.36 TaxID=1168546 RepID=A0A9P4J7A0_9PEZI|nr:hypothetical protein K461DRAFT_115298 [Myriangium duriaei CBS 260.36]
MSCLHMFQSKSRFPKITPASSFSSHCLCGVSANGLYLVLIPNPDQNLRYTTLVPPLCTYCAPVRPFAFATTMRIVFLATWLLYFAKGALADNYAFAYEMIYFYKAYLIDYMANGNSRTIGPGIAHVPRLNPDGSLPPEEKAWQFQGDGLHMPGAATFDDFVRQTCQPGTTLWNNYEAQNFQWDPTSVKDFQATYGITEYGVLGPKPPKRAPFLRYNFNAIMPSQFPQWDSNNKGMWKIDELLYKVQNRVSVAINTLHANGLDETNFVKATYDKYKRSLNMACLMRRQSNADFMAEEARDKVGRSPSLELFWDTVDERTQIEVPSYDGSVDKFTFPEWDTRSLAQVPGATQQLQQRLLNAVVSLGMRSGGAEPADLNSGPGQKWIHGNAIVLMDRGQKKFDEDQARLCGR